MAHILLSAQTQNPSAIIGINWAYKFVKCHPALRTQYNQRITYQHAKQEDLRVIKPWFTTIRKAIQEYGIHEDDIWNFDETGFAMGLCSTSKVITAVEHSKRPQRVIQRNCEQVTIIKYASSKGIAILPVFILKGKEHQATQYQKPNFPQDQKITNSANGWTIDKIGLKQLEQVFDPFSRPYSTGAKQLLILDGHLSYQTAEFDYFCKENAIICLYMLLYILYLL